MITLPVVVKQVAEIAELTASFIAQAANNLIGKAQGLTLPQISSRLGHAIAALKGENVPASGAIFTTQEASLAIAREIVASYSFNKGTGVSTFSIPAGVTDVEAMVALNEYFRKTHSGFNRDVIYAPDLEWFERLPREYRTHCQERDYSQTRRISITGVVEGTKGENRDIQKTLLEEASLGFSDPRDQALAAAIHACKHDGDDLFRDLWVRCSVPGFALGTSQDDGLFVYRCHDYDDELIVAASGSALPELN